MINLCPRDQERLHEVDDGVWACHECRGRFYDAEAIRNSVGRVGVRLIGRAKTVATGLSCLVCDRTMYIVEHRRIPEVDRCDCGAMWFDKDEFVAVGRAADGAMTPGRFVAELIVEMFNPLNWLDGA